MAPAHASAPSDLRTETSRDPSGDGAQRPTALKTWNGSMKPATSANGMEAAPLTYCASPSVPRRTRSTRARSKREPTCATARPRKSPGASPTHPSLTGSTPRPSSLPA